MAALGLKKPELTPHSFLQSLDLDRPHVCRYCRARFDRPGDCERHVRAHEKDQEFWCHNPQCPASPEYRIFYRAGTSPFTRASALVERLANNKFSRPPKTLGNAIGNGTSNAGIGGTTPPRVAHTTNSTRRRSHIFLPASLLNLLLEGKHPPGRECVDPPL
jgi:hypothetical protein